MYINISLTFRIIGFIMHFFSLKVMKFKKKKSEIYRKLMHIFKYTLI